MRCKALKPASDSRLQDFLGTLQSFEAYTPKIPGRGYFIFPEIPGVHVNSPLKATPFIANCWRKEARTTTRSYVHASRRRAMCQPLTT